MSSSTLTIRIDDDLKRGASEVADYYGLDLSSVTRAFYKQMVNTRRIPLTFAPDEPSIESLEAIREGDAFLSSGEKGRFDNAADLGDALVGRGALALGCGHGPHPGGEPSPHPFRRCDLDCTRVNQRQAVHGEHGLATS